MAGVLVCATVGLAVEAPDELLLTVKDDARSPGVSGPITF